MPGVPLNAVTSSNQLCGSKVKQPATGADQIRQRRPRSVLGEFDVLTGEIAGSSPDRAA